MKQEEEDVLVINKTQEGKRLERIYQEIETLKQSQVKFRHQNRIIKTKSNEVEKLNEIIKDLKKKNFNLNLRLNSIYKEERDKKIENGNGDIKKIDRILIILKTENRPMGITELSRYCCSVNSSLNICINFMKRYNLIEQVNEHGVTKYNISKQMKGGLK